MIVWFVVHAVYTFTSAFANGEYTVHLGVKGGWRETNF